MPQNSFVEYFLCTGLAKYTRASPPARKLPWSSGNVKQEIITRNWTYNHELPDNLRLMILRNDELLRLFTWVFVDLMIRGFEFVTRGFELVTRELGLLTRGFELVHLWIQTRNSWIRTRNFEQLWISTRAFKLSARNW